jgi:hypothetical protein
MIQKRRFTSVRASDERDVAAAEIFGSHTKNLITERQRRSDSSSEK